LRLSDEIFLKFFWKLLKKSNFENNFYFESEFFKNLNFENKFVNYFNFKSEFTNNWNFENELLDNFNFEKLEYLKNWISKVNHLKYFNVKSEFLIYSNFESEFLINLNFESDLISILVLQTIWTVKVNSNFSRIYFENLRLILIFIKNPFNILSHFSTQKSWKQTPNNRKLIFIIIILRVSND